MWTTLITAFDKAKYWLVALGVTLLYLCGGHSGKTAEKVKTMKGTIDVVKNAKQSRDSLNDPERVKRLYDKYKR